MISPGKHIVILGDAMIDRWVYGTIERISPEAPVPIFLEDYYEETPGGAANVAENVKALGCIPHLITSGNRPLKIRHIVNGQQVFRHDVEEIIPAHDDQIMEALEEIEHADAAIISDYAKGVCTPFACRHLIAWAKQRSIPVIADPKGTSWHKYAGADVVTPNIAELHEAEKVYTVDPGFGAVLVTKGAQGMTLTSLKHNLKIPAVGPKVVDVTGAGDTVVATLACTLASGLDLETAARLANAAAGIVVGKRGTATCSLEELTKAWQPKQKVGFANGAFDNLHEGHLHFLRECWMNCSKLIVAINSDAMVRKLKGDGRPIKREHERAEALLATGLVAGVNSFGTEEDLLEMMEGLKPDVIFKGEDYYESFVTGSHLAPIHWVARHPGYSTTQFAK